MNRKGVSMILEYLILASILSVFVFTVSLALNDVLEKSQLERVVNNQFADVASEVSSQIVDILAIYPRNGNMTVKVFMPEKIGDIEYIVKLEGNSIKIESDDGRFSKYLSLGAAHLKLQDLGGFTHSLEEAHQLKYTKTSCVFPSAVLSVRPSAITVPGNFTVDSSASSSPPGTTYEWRVKWWNGTWTGWYPQSVNQIKVEINSWKSEFETDCNYNSTSETAECEIVLEVRTTCQSEVLNDTDAKTILIAKPTATGTANITVDKFVKPPQAEPGDTVELHIRLDGKGISGGKTVNLTVSLAIDSSGSMDYPTLFTSFSGSFTGNTETLEVCLPDYLTTYEYLRAEIPSGYSYIKIEKIDSKNCDSKVCEIPNVASGCHHIIIKRTSSSVVNYEVQVFIQKLDAAKIAAIDYLENLEAGDYVGVTEYDDDAFSYQVNSGYLTYLTTDKSVVEDKIKTFVADGATNIYHALWRANETLYDNTTITAGTIPLIILMTDGKPTVEAYVSKSDCWDTCCKVTDLLGNCLDWDCPSSDWWYTRDGIEFCRYGWWCTDNCNKQLEDLAEQIKQNKIGDENIRICTIGFGRPGDYNATLLENMASYVNQTTKCFFTAQTADELQDAFRTIAQSFEIAGKDINITDVIPSSVSVGSVTVGAEGSPVCDAPEKTTDASGNTTVKLTCSEIHPDDVIDLVIQIEAYEPGTYLLDIPNVSNVTYVDINKNIRKIDLEVVQVRYATPSEAEVRIE